MRRLPGTIGAVALAILLPIGAVVSQAPGDSYATDKDDGAIVTVEALHEALFAVMRQADTLSFADRRQRLAPVVRRSFDFETISATVLGASQWKELTETQRSKMKETFRELTLATYADRFDGYSGEQFETLSQRPLRRGRALVRSELRIPDEEPVRLDYVLQRVGDEWRIVNILADGVSDLSVKRAEYSSILRTAGFDQLIAQLQEQIAELSAD
ncbi:MAG: ABC transporter substrate-binding protein [Gammaproteobacteria bacterium]|jgi:phospholipid transport system substrate-binding protein